MSAGAEALGVAGRFATEARAVGAERFVGGHINRSWIVTCADGGRLTTRYLLQRINERVFPRPDRVMENVERVAAHLGPPPALVRTRDGDRAWHVDDGGGHWRMWTFVEGAVSVERPADADAAYQAGRAFGDFQRRMRDYRGPRLHETIPGFHDTPARLAALERAAAADPLGRAAPARSALTWVAERRELAGALADRLRRGELAERVVHNDAKMSNVLLDAATGAAVCVVDLDTVMPGLSLWDFGDMARSMTGTAPEDEPDAARMDVRRDLFAGAARGWLDGAGELVTAAERALLVTAAQVITFEQGVRFLADYLLGDVYYPVARPEHNLERCRAQFALVDAFTREEPRLMRAVRRS